MSEANDIVTFGVTRSDLLYDFDDQLGGIFKFSPRFDEEATSEDGVRLVEVDGFDFARECRPWVLISPLDVGTEDIGLPAESLRIYVTLEDSGLHSRSLIFEADADSIVEARRVEIDLTNTGSAFTGGFQVRCFITPKETASRKAGAIWHKSQVVLRQKLHRKNF